MVGNAVVAQGAGAHDETAGVQAGYEASRGTRGNEALRTELDQFLQHDGRRRRPDAEVPRDRHPAARFLEKGHVIPEIAVMKAHGMVFYDVIEQGFLVTQYNRLRRRFIVAQEL